MTKEITEIITPLESQETSTEELQAGEIKRALATIQTISQLEPIVFTNKEGVEETASAIERASFENIGWHCVVNKGEFKVGDLAVYHEIDSMLDKNNPVYGFLVDVNRPDKPLRLRSKRMLGFLSQGLALRPEDVFKHIEYDYDGDGVYVFELPEDDERHYLEFKLEDGQDLTEILNIKKYIDPENGPGNSNRTKTKGYFPSFLRRTDEIRLEAAKGLLEAVRNIPLYASMKLDGMSNSIFLKDGVFGVCSRNLETARCEGNKFWEVVDKYDIETQMRNMGDNIAIQGELVGPGIQNNRLKLKEVDLYVFNFYDIATGQYLDYEDFVLNTKALGLKTVPIYTENFIIGDRTVDDMVAISDGLKINLSGEEVMAEGLVWRCMKEMRDYRGNRISFKILNNSYLLKYSL